MFDEPTRKASQGNLQGFGDAFAGRGGDVGRTLEELPPLLRALAPVMRNLADPQTDLDGFFRELGDAARDRRAGVASRTPRCSPRWPTRSRRSRATSRR